MEEQNQKLVKYTPEENIQISLLMFIIWLTIVFIAGLMTMFLFTL